MCIRDSYCPVWSLYPRQYGDMCYDQLRTIIRDGLGAPAWIEIYAGRSWLQYRSLDVYWSMRSSLSDPPDVVRWVLNSTVPPLERQEIEPAQWLMCKDWVCCGKHKECFADYVLRPPEMAVLQQVPFECLSVAAVEARRNGILQHPMPGIPLPFPTDREREAYQVFLRNRSIGKGNKGIGKGKIALPRL